MIRDVMAMVPPLVGAGVEALVLAEVTAVAAGACGRGAPGVGAGEAGGPPPWAFDPYGPGPYWQEAPYESPQEEIAALKDQEASLRGEIEATQKRLAELEKEASGQ
jgi:hypothetical protein